MFIAHVSSLATVFLFVLGLFSIGCYGFSNPFDRRGSDAFTTPRTVVYSKRATSLAGIDDRRKEVVDVGIAITDTSANRSTDDSTLSERRRSVLLTTFVTTAAAAATACTVSSTPSSAADSGVVELRLERKEPAGLGLELRPVTLSNGRQVLAIKSVSPTGAAAAAAAKLGTHAAVRPGMVLLDYGDAASLVERLRKGPYPLTLRVRNLAAGGDATGDLGETLVDPRDALRLATARSDEDVATTTTTTTKRGYEVRTSKSRTCGATSRRGDVLEIRYEARYYREGDDDAAATVYDGSRQRGTGLPYQMVLGSGDMIPGVDNGLYDMCPGEVREIDVPPALGYGARGRALYGIPDGARLRWTVEMVTVNGVGEGDDRSRDELEGRVAY